MGQQLLCSQGLDEVPHISSYDFGLFSRLSRQVGNNGLQALSTLQPLPHIGSSRVERRNLSQLCIQHRGPILVHDGPKMGVVIHHEHTSRLGSCIESSDEDELTPTASPCKRKLLVWPNIL